LLSDRPKKQLLLLLLQLHRLAQMCKSVQLQQQQQQGQGCLAVISFGTA